MKIKLEVISDNQKNRFYKLLPLYKSLIFKIFKFNIKTDDEQIKIIESALNIKRRSKRIKFVYDKTCNYVDDYFKGKNICGFKNNLCFCAKYTNEINGCCRLCKYQSSKGCKTSNLTCKMYFCTEVRKRYKVLEFNNLKMLKILSLRQRLILKHDYFSKRNAVLFDLYTGSIIITSIRMFIRLIIMLITYKNNAIIKKKEGNKNERCSRCNN